MRLFLTAPQLVAGALALTSVALAWFFLAPPALGGATTWVVTSGISMQPRFHSGDLVLVRGADDYRGGEIVAYRNRMLQTIVLHRIIGRDGLRYVFKGDNNDFVDPEHPARGQLVGKLWLHLPGAGRKLQRLKSPGTIAVLAGMASLALLGGSSASRRRRRRGEPHRPRPDDSQLQAAVLAAGLALAAFLAVGALAVSRPTERTVPGSAPYTQSGSFSYSATARSGTVYPAGRVVTGDPVFLQLVDRLQVGFDYRLGPAGRSRVTGRASLDAVIASSTGWKRTLHLQPARRFGGGHAAVGGTLELRPLPGLLSRVEAATQVSGATYTVTLVPRIRVSGMLGGAPLRASLSPRLAFSLDPLKLQPVLTPSTAAADPLRPSTRGAVQTTERRARVLSLRVVHVRVATLRAVAGLGALAALIVLLGCAHLLLYGVAPDEPRRIQSRYRRVLIPAARVREDVVEVPTMEALARLAERYERVILHEETELGHSYRFADDGVVYVYRVGVPASPVELNRAAAPTDLAA